MGHLDFQAALRRLSRKKRFITVAHPCDIHQPDHNQDALDLTYKLYDAVRPDIFVRGSDQNAHDNLGKFTPNPDSVEQTRDEVKQSGLFNLELSTRFHDMTGGAIQVWIDGNHDKPRLDNYLHQHAPKVRDVVEEAWIKGVKAGGLVHYIGNVSEVLIGNLLIKHGDVTTENAAKTMLTNVGFQVSIVAGHVHRFTYFNFNGHHHMIKAMTSGCLCNLIPSYMAVKGQKPRKAWQLGTIISTVDTQTNNVWMDDYIYLRDEKGTLSTFLKDAVVMA